MHIDWAQMIVDEIDDVIAAFKQNFALLRMSRAQAEEDQVL